MLDNIKRFTWIEEGREMETAPCVYAVRKGALCQDYETSLGNPNTQMPLCPPERRARCLQRIYEEEQKYKVQIASCHKSKGQSKAAT